MAFEHCVTSTNSSNIKVKERGKSVNFRNRDREAYQKIQIDGCVVRQGSRADWIVRKIGVGSVVIELKGRDLGHACEQVFSTLDHGDCGQFIEDRKGILIVTSRRPKYNTQTARAAERARRLGAKLTVKSDQVDADFEAML